MLNNISIRNLTGIITAICGVIFLSNIFLIFHYLEKEIDYSVLFVSSFIGLTTLYFIILFLLEKFIFNKLKIIYKFIDKSKGKEGKKSKTDFPITSIDDVSSDVMEWASKAEKRIESLKTLADYRKDFVGNVSHELKTPIFSLQGYLHTLLDGGIYDENINLKYIKKAAVNADRLQHIVEDLESIGQMESGKIDLEFERFDIYTLLKEVVSEQSRQAKVLGISLNTTFPYELPLWVSADKEAIRQILSNLITNSLKYGESGGETTISVFNVNKSILIEIGDNGIGIENHHLEHLFDRFYRVDKSRSRLKGGSGLGLSIVKHLVEAHNQTITVRSTIGVGSTFGFTLEKA